ncbi:hypothetical protein SK128_026674 [Halocaridina rubra]|uniref:Ig-like domain-containing protein n=1 Tax=Halocaridina rubra TaxID=373956 RepID=A0AAN8ZYR6_HALRR
MAREYMIENASSERDSGNYSCRASNSQRDVTSEPTSVYINVMPLDYSNVTLVPDHPNITDIAEDELRWLVMYRAYPEPIFIWKKEGKLLVDSSRSDGDKRYKLEQKLQDGQIFLEISSPTTTDIGTYTLDAMIRKDDKIVAEHQVLLSYFTPVAPNFTVVEINPESPNGVIPFEETITMTCKSQGYPKPDLTLEFKQCFDSGNCTNFAPVSEDHTYSSSPSEETVVNATSVWSTKARIHGYYRCVGENRHGTQLSAAKEFSVAEGPHEVLSLEVMVNGDPKLGQETEVIEGDNVTIRCRGNKMRTSSNLEWTLNTSPLDLKDHPNTLLRQVDTDLSYVSEYVIKSITLQTTDLDFQCFDSQERGAVTRTRIYVNRKYFYFRLYIKNYFVMMEIPT